MLGFAKKFWGLTAWMLELTVAVSILLGKYLEFYIITALLVFNALLGTVQEAQASSAVRALRSKLKVNARVLRDGGWLRIPARELVPGDVVRLRAGDFIPADLKLMSGQLEIDQSSLTGESLPVSKEAGEVLYSGSIVKTGEASAVVLSTGVSTYYGKTAELVRAARPSFHLEGVTSSVVKWLLVMVGTLLAATLIVSMVRGTNVLDMLPLVLVLLVSAIPVALPTMFVISMALGSVELARKGVLITRLSAVEDAATMDTLCVDKTGTITMNSLEITRILPMAGFDEDDVVALGALASNEADQDPIDIAFLRSAKAHHSAFSGLPQKEFVPFNPTMKRTEAVALKDGRRIRVMKGAVRVLAEFCRLDQDEMRGVEQNMDEFAKSGYRTLAVAVVDEGGLPRFSGLVALWDPPRPDSAQLVKSLRDLGVSVKMLTGDAVPVAQEMLKQVGLGPNIVRASELKKLVEEGPEKAAEIAEKSDGYAEVYPEDKYVIVKQLQSKGHVIGMTGDGVNDAPALRQAEVGIAVSNATDVAKGAASAVLTDEGLSNILNLPSMGRMIYQRVVIWIVNKIVKTFEVVVFASLAFIFTGLAVVGAFQIVLLLLMNDFVTISLSTDNVRWSRKPDTWKISKLVKVAIMLGVLTIAEHFALLYAGLRYLDLGSDIAKLNTFAFGMLFYSAMFMIFLVRERGHFWRSVPSRTLLTAVVADIVLVMFITTLGIPGLAPIPIRYTLYMIVYYMFFVLVVDDAIKTLLVKRAGLSW